MRVPQGLPLNYMREMGMVDGELKVLPFFYYGFDIYEEVVEHMLSGGITVDLK